MKKDSLPLLNSAALVALVLGGGVYVLFGRGPQEEAEGQREGGAPSTAQPLATPDPVVRALQERVAALEAEVAGLREQRADPRAILGRSRSAGDTTSTTAPLTDEVAPETSAARVDSEAVRALVREELDARRRAREQRQAAAAQQQAKPKKTLREVSQELALAPPVETQIRTHYRELEDESMRVLFALKPEDDLDELAGQFERSKHDPELKERLRQTLMENWTRNQSEFWVLFVKLDGKLRKVLPKETLAKFYRYEVKLEEPRFPDMRTFFNEGQPGQQGR